MTAKHQYTATVYSTFEGRVAWQLLLTELAVGVVAVLKAYQPRVIVLPTTETTTMVEL